MYNYIFIIINIIYQIYMYQYLNLIDNILKYGIIKKNRTNIDTKSIFGYEMRFDPKKGFPLLTTKKIHLKSIIYELLWFLKGETNIKYLKNKKISIWDEWADENGELGPIYGFQWRNWPSNNGNKIDQIKNVIEEIIKHPNSRRLIVSAWNVSMIENMALPPCHVLFQFYVANGKLSLLLYQRSADVFLGLPFNIASYTLLLMMIAQVTKLHLGEFIHIIGDAHIYLNHIEQAKIQIKRHPRSLPEMIINPNITDLLNFNFKDFTLKNYNPYPHIKANVVI